MEPNPAATSNPAEPMLMQNQPPPGGYPPGGYAQPPPGGYAQPPPGGYAQPPPGGVYPQLPPGGQPPPGGQYQQPGYMQPQMQPMAMQAPGQTWMPKPVTDPSCPPGLEYLTQIDQLIVKQVIELLEALSGFETANKYKIFNSMNQQCYFAGEESGLCERQCCGPARGFQIHITDNVGQEIIKVIREFKCCAGCCWCACSDCCAFELTIEAPPGQVIGYVRQEQTFWKPEYSIRDASHETMAIIAGPCCMCNSPCCGDVEFPVMSKDGEKEIGKISKKWSGMGAEYFTDADTFGVTFPMDMDVKMKATLLGAVFLIDFMYFEQKQNKDRHHH